MCVMISVCEMFLTTHVNKQPVSRLSEIMWRLSQKCLAHDTSTPLRPVYMVTMDTQFKRCTLKSLQSKLYEAYNQSNVTKMTIVSELERVSTARYCKRKSFCADYSYLIKTYVVSFLINQLFIQTYILIWKRVLL